MIREHRERARAIVGAYFSETGAGAEFLAEDSARLLHEMLADESHARDRRRFAGILLFAAGIALAVGVLEVQRRAPCYEDEIRVSTGACVPIDELRTPRDGLIYIQ